MKDLDVRIAKLDPMRVASAHAFGPNPETEAMNKLQAWAEPMGLLADPKRHRIFGFNNPDPSPGSPNYGYEFWIAVGPDVEAEGDIKIKEFSGGLYAVTRCEVQGDAYDIIPATWQQLVAWREDSPYRCATHQWLEEVLGPPGSSDNFVLDLCLPITE
jgi:AraC family transcriptional regulator